MARSAASIQTEIDAWEAHLFAAAQNGGIAEYSLDSGQSRQSVKRYTMAEIEARLKSLYAELRLAESGVSPSVRFVRHP